MAVARLSRAAARTFVPRLSRDPPRLLPACLSDVSDPLCFSFFDDLRSDVEPMSAVSLLSDFTVNEVRTSSSPR